MTLRQRPGDILLETPLSANADVVPAVEDRSYLLFIGGALASALLGGFLLGVAAALAGAGVWWDSRLPWLIQAHGWAQLQGWAGLFVAGMGFRLLPRFAGRRPLPRSVTIFVWALLTAGTLVRTVSQLVSDPDIASIGLFIGLCLWAAGAAGFALTLGATLRHGRGRGHPWHAFAFAGLAWWLVWSVVSIVAAIRGARNDAFVPATFDEAMTWLVMLGAVSNFIWAIQSRSVPIFFGRKTPSLRRVAIPGTFLNAGVALIILAEPLAAGATEARLSGAGFVLAGIALAWLPPLAGSCWGEPVRLRPRARFAARFVLFANITAMFAGLLLIWAGARTFIDAEFAAQGARDAARHAFGIGVITALIVGMAQLVAPFFALRRVEAHSAALLDHAVFWLLVAATVIRVGAALAIDAIDTEPRMHLNATAGVLAWVALVLFAATVFQALRNEGRIKENVARNAREAARR